MSYQNTEILKDQKGQPIPQYLDPSTGLFKPLVKGDFVGYSTDTKPTITYYNHGTTISFLELDTGVVYIYDGTDWVVI